MQKQSYLILLVCMLYAPSLLMAQKTGQRPPDIGASFLLVNPDARSSGAGNAPTGLTPDVNALFSNAAKIVFAGDWGVSANYAPWMWELNNSESNMAYVAAFKNFGQDQNQGIGISMKYFNYGSMTFRDDNGTVLQDYNPREFAIDGSYARKLGQRTSLAISLRYIRSQLGEGNYNGLQQKPASAVGGDIGFYYQNTADNLDFGNRYSFGVSITNIGTKLSYTDDKDRKSFLPMNLRIGGGYAFVNTDYNTFTLTLEVNKLLVPTPPIYALDSNGLMTNQILKGKDPNRGVVESIFSSFGDAPDGFQEELREFTIGAGVEYSYKQTLFLRAGYFYEHPNKGYRQHFTSGLGVRFSNVELDMAYLIPTDGSLYQKKTLMFSLLYNINKDH
ncbi:type IX secretion system outer membrane channel protein PorV [Chitinophaga sp. sic0106]|uniref:type IX secretion system outer membrane channel protein PorV n=1 Tax=Chitinophaga sp. sic0106 TaxID=2854785 RepID=UPI001C44C5F2|nr:type IX secretion system outer membrane channel protein PorV [Chitinophaga sp. sic0106]MBV7533837.1 type IX secretion system outer membrane channel protein PorV [Chitinophaga sp. sic0106]